MEPVDNGINARQFLRRPEVNYQVINALVPPPVPLPESVIEQVSIETKFEGYIAKQLQQVERMRRLESRRIPSQLNYENIPGLRNEAKEKLSHFRPATVGQSVLARPQPLEQRPGKSLQVLDVARVSRVVVVLFVPFEFHLLVRQL